MFAKLLLLFILIPLAELFIFIRLGSKLGFPLTLAIIIVTAILGAALTKSQGRQALAKFQQALREGRMPHREATDGLIILVAGALLLTPGFLTDTVGFCLLLPPIRALIRGSLAQVLKDKIRIVPNMNPMQDGTNFPEESNNKGSKLDDGKVIDV